MRTLREGCAAGPARDERCNGWWVDPSSDDRVGENPALMPRSTKSALMRRFAGYVERGHGAQALQQIGPELVEAYVAAPTHDARNQVRRPLAERGSVEEDDDVEHEAAAS
jgi:hypothetical protein